MKKILICMIVAMLLLVSTVMATSKLEITEVEIKVDGDKEDVSDGESIDIKPGDSLKIKVKVANTYTDAEDIEIKNVDVEITIQDFDDGDDEEDTQDADDIRANDDETVDFDFDTPWDIGEDTYKVEILADGKDKNGTLHKANFTFFLEVDKDKHNVIFTKTELTRSEIKCGQSTDLTVSVLNIGTEDEDDTELHVSSPELGLDRKVTFDLEEGEFDDDMKATRVFRVSTTEEVKPGVYPINIKLTYDEGDRIENKDLDLTVASCEVEKVVEEPEEEEKEEVKEEVVVQAPPPVIQPPQLQPPMLSVEKPAVEEEAGFLDNYGVALVVLLYLAVIAIAVVVFAFVFRRSE